MAQTASVIHPTSSTSNDGSISVNWSGGGAKGVELNGVWQGNNVLDFNGLDEGDYDLVYWQKSGRNWSQVGSETVTLIADPYCSAKATLNDEYISRVQVGSIDKSSGWSGYADYTSQSTDVNIGVGYSIIITNGKWYNGDQYGVWVDWNQDGDFNDADETIVSVSGNAVFTTIITPPTNAVAGNTRMRVRVSYYVAPVACGNTTYGEVEDYTLNIVSSTLNSPPVITASGNQSFCPASTPLKIVGSISITDVDPGDTHLDVMSVQISEGYVAAEDLLSLSVPVAGITSSWDGGTGKLTLTGPAVFARFESAISNVQYTNTNSTPTAGARKFSITLQQANYLPGTDHFYEFVPDVGIRWDDARDAAAARTYYGLQGYLATLTSQEEADLAGSQITGAGWIGASDAALEDEWRWVTGPEGDEESGKGRLFWIGNGSGANPPNKGSVVPGEYANWNGTAEPNDSGGEDYAHINARNVGVIGGWNDLSITGAASGDYQPKGYVVEYGGTTGDPALQISASTMITVKADAKISLSSAVGTNSQSLCSNNAILDITYNVTNGTGATVSGLPSGVNGTYSGGIFTISGTPGVEGVFPYTVTATGDCASAEIGGTITVNALPAINNPGDQTVCDSYILPVITGSNLSGSESYYTVTNGGGTKYNAGNIINSTTTLYIYDINGVCSDEESFDITVTSEPVINIVTTANTTCATAGDGQIVVNDITVGLGTVEYSVDGASWQSSNTFTGLSAGSYDVKIRTEAGGQYCESAVKTVSIASPSDINISSSNLVDATCTASTDGEIAISVSGGGQTMHFDGADSYIALDLNYNSTTAIPKMTVAAWVKVGATSGVGGWSILDFDRSEYFNFTIGGLNASDAYHVSFNTRSPSGNIHDFNSIATIDDDQWHFVVGVYDGTDKYIYIDGVLDSSTANPHSGSALGSSNARYAFVGAGSEASTYNGNRNGGRIFSGGIADVWYFESSITDSGELNGLSNGIIPGGHTAKGHWRLNDIGNGFISNLADPNSYGEVFGMDPSNVSNANLYTFSCTKDGASFSLDGIISEENPNNYKLINLGVGDYVLTATDNNGCFKNTSFTIGNGDVTPPVITNCPSNITVGACSNTVNWTAPTANDNCSVTLTSTHNPGDTFTVGTTTTVTYTATDGAGLTAACSFDVTVLPEISASITADNNTICEGEAVTVTASGVGGKAPYTYEFYLNDTPIVSNADYTIVGDKLSSSLFNNNDKIKVKITDNNTCEKTSPDITMTVNDLPNTSDILHN